MDDSELKALKVDLLGRPENSGRELVCYGSSKGAVFFRIPNLTDVDAYKTRLAGERRNAHEANKALLVTCLAHPPADQFKSMVNDRPFLIDKWFDKLSDAAGLAENVEEKKL